MIKAFMGVLVFITSIDKVLLAECASLAGTLALVEARLDNLGLLTGVTVGSLGNGVVAEEDRALAVIAGRVLQTESKTGVIASLVVLPVLGCKLDTLSNMCT